MSKRTPGNWSVFYRPIAHEIQIMSDGGWVVCHLLCGVSGTYDTQEANARLIAAAPELLGVLRESRDVLRELRKEPEHVFSPEQWTLIDASWSNIIGAIAKAEGDQP